MEVRRRDQGYSAGAYARTACSEGPASVGNLILVRLFRPAVSAAAYFRRAELNLNLPLSEIEIDTRDPPAISTFEPGS
jgi:hypothetical protein